MVELVSPEELLEPPEELLELPFWPEHDPRSKMRKNNGKKFWIF